VTPTAESPVHRGWDEHWGLAIARRKTLGIFEALGKVKTEPFISGVGADAALEWGF